jgi:hypothetical protein
MEYEDRIWELISLKLTGEITAAEWQELSAVLEADAQAAKLMQLLTDLWKPGGSQPGDETTSGG